MSTTIERQGLWGVIEAKLASLPDGDGPLWRELAILVDPAGFRPKLSSDIEVKRLQQTSVVVEMTPHYRAQFKPKWTDTFLRQFRTELHGNALAIT